MKARTILVALLILPLSFAGCGPKRTAQGPWEYAELSYTYKAITSGRIGFNAPLPTEQGMEMRFELGDSTLVSETYAGLLEKLGAETPKQECSTAVLNFLDQKGWELVDHSASSVASSMVVQDGNMGSNVSETQIDKLIWTLRRAR